MRTIAIIASLLITNLIFSQENKSTLCLPMFNSNSFSFELDTLESSESDVSYLIDKNYQIDLDETQFIDGKKSVGITGLNQDSKTYATLSLTVPIKIKKNAHIVLSVWVKTDSLYGVNSIAMLRLMGHRDKDTGTFPLFKFGEKTLKGSEDWTQITLAAVVKTDENFIVLSGLMQGKGKAWFDNFELKIDGEDIKNVSFFKDNNQLNTVTNTLSKYITKIEDNNLEQVSNFISNQNSKVRIIGLGEATHGTSEIYSYKSDLIKTLIKNNNVTKIALEAYYTNTEDLNTYILKGEGNLKKILANIGFWSYYTIEFKELVIWLKNYNKKTNNKIIIVGVDSQSGGNALKILTERTKRNTHISTILKELKKDSTEISDKIRISNSILQELIKTNQDKNIIMNARELSQSYFVNQYKGLKYTSVRDSLQAFNIGNVEKELASDEKMIYWAHDQHIRKKPNSAGGFLNEKYKDRYVNVGFLLENGKYSAVDKDTKKLDSDNDLKLVKCTSLENLMGKYNYPTILLNSKSALTDPYLKNNLFNKLLVKRSIGALETNYQFISLNNDPNTFFDLLIYIKDSNPSQLIK
ncbi:Erythromycin esterase homolog [Olleya namhaensis]|uniref:Erythromycin esterase homolog n=2 Tax=Olleya namhaensis TaxID=1144750 RepID=A0A1I3SP13_9FLAO|nr:Erythromycin esterase homolog [Olleya namhaensis]